MSQAAFQARLARLLVDNAFRDDVRERGEEALDGELTAVERRRLVAVASDNGLGVTRTLHDGWRMSKVLLMLPLTCVVLGDLLAEELKAFWPTRVPRSLYFHGEAIAFCDHLLRPDGPRPRYLDEVAAFERATLVLRTAWSGERPAPQQVPFRHDPEVLLAALAEGAVPAEVPERPIVLVGLPPVSGQVEWRLAQVPVEAPSEMPLTPAIS